MCYLESFNLSLHRFAIVSWFLDDMFYIKSVANAGNIVISGN